MKLRSFGTHALSLSLILAMLFGACVIALPIQASAQQGIDPCSYSGNTQAGGECDTTAEPGEREWSMTSPSQWMWWTLATVFHDGILALLSLFVGWSGAAFNFALQIFVIGMADLINSNGAINVGWSVMRDIANAVFLFILIYIGLQAILRAGQQWKRSLGIIIAAAILVNFSMLLAKVVIDVSNVMAIEIHSAFGLPPECSDNSMANNDLFQCYNTGVGGIFMNNFSLGSFEGYPPDLVNKYVFFASFAAIPFYVITIFVFVAGAIFLLMRFVVLVVVLVFSPLAFAALVIPRMSSYWDQWISALLKQSFFAPMFLLMIWLSVKTMEAIGGGAAASADSASALYPGANKFADALFNEDPNNWSLINVMFFFGLMSTFLIASLIIARKFGIVGAKTVIGYGHSMRRGAWKYTKRGSYKAYDSTAGEIGRGMKRDLAAGLGMMEREPINKFEKAILNIPGVRSRVQRFAKQAPSRVQELNKRNKEFTTDELARQIGKGKIATNDQLASILQIATERREQGKLPNEVILGGLAAMKRMNMNLNDIVRPAPYMVHHAYSTVPEQIAALERVIPRMSSDEIRNLNWKEMENIAKTHEETHNAILETMQRGFNGGQVGTLFAEGSDFSRGFAEYMRRAALEFSKTLTEEERKKITMKNGEINDTKLVALYLKSGGAGRSAINAKMGDWVNNTAGRRALNAQYDVEDEEEDKDQKKK